MRHLSVVEPCSEDWGRMEGDRDRRCAACDRVVHDLGSRTRAELVELLVLHAGARICTRVSVDEAGAIVAADGVLADVPRERARPWRAPVVAALGAAALACAAPAAVAPVAAAPARDVARAAPAAPAAPPPASPPVDTDGDGIADGFDGCPTVAGVDPDGCPAKVVVVMQGVTVVTPQVHFAYGSAKPYAPSRTLLDEVANIMRDHPEVRLVHVEGHASSDERDGRHLSEARAQSIVRELVQRGVDAARLDTTAFAAERPIAPNDTPENRARNRRIEFRVDDANDRTM